MRLLYYRMLSIESFLKGRTGNLEKTTEYDGLFSGTRTRTRVVPVLVRMPVAYR